jgi:hypothetical protein
MNRVLVAAFAALLLSGEVVAEGFRTISDRVDFLNLIDGKQLTRFGIRLDVAPSGEIRGRAFGQEVSGGWQWSDGYFCRDLEYGSQVLELNCQVVQVNGDTVRFIADRGTGDTADLNLR